MKTPFKIIALSLLAVPALAGARATAGAALDSLRVVGVEMSRQGDMMSVDYSFDLSGLRPASSESFVLTPVLVGEDGSQAVLQPVVLNGRNAQIKYERERSRRIPGATVLRYSKGAETLWQGSAEMPYEPWMDLCRLTLREDLCGCGDLLSQLSREVGGVFDNRPAPEMEVVFIQPVVEATKARAEEGSAFVDYQVNKTNILPDYRSNRAEIAKITATIDLVKNDPLVSITEINIHGYASPEGSYANNARLAEGRALSLKDYVRGLYTLPDRLFTSASTPEDWAGLRVLVAKSALADREAILGVIDSDMAPDAKDAALKGRFPQSYQVMLTQMYPALRHSDYTVKYVVRPLTVEETAEVMRVSPRKASLQEMFLVAQTFEPGSEGFNEAMAIAVATYPDDPVANLNAALVALKAGDLDTAERHLDRAGDTGEARQARGLLAMKRGDYDTAGRLLRDAEQAGIATAAHNLAVLERTRQLAGQNR